MKGGIKMKIQIRQGVFETNSSSMHSLTVMKRDEKYTPEEIMQGFYLCNSDTGEKNCVWEPYESDMEFGRTPFRVLCTFHDKWLYACASMVRKYNDDTYKELAAIALKYVKGLKTIKLPKSWESIERRSQGTRNEYCRRNGKTEKELCEYLSQKEKEWELKEGELHYWKASNEYWHYDVPYTGCVDEDILSDFLEHKNISLEDFLTNKKYVVIQDGDEYQYWEDMKKSGLVNLDIIDYEFSYWDE